jgi:hypothetical protein
LVANYRLGRSSRKSQIVENKHWMMRNHAIPSLLQVNNL